MTIDVSPAGLHWVADVVSIAFVVHAYSGLSSSRAISVAVACAWDHLPIKDLPIRSSLMCHLWSDEHHFARLLVVWALIISILLLRAAHCNTVLPVSTCMKVVLKAIVIIFPMVV